MDKNNKTQLLSRCVCGKVLGFTRVSGYYVLDFNGRIRKLLLRGQSVLSYQVSEECATTSRFQIDKNQCNRCDHRANKWNPAQSLAKEYHANKHCEQHTTRT